ncbi:DUF397 domain-containing protein [Streptomyces griseocarneus]|nr:DUF397 domain-containing protein [Streptomyces griseocarneus]
MRSAPGPIWTKATYSGGNGGQCLEWAKSSYSEGDAGQCVEWAPAPAPTTDAIAIRDSKHPGPGLILPPTTWSALIDGLRP